MDDSFTYKLIIAYDGSNYSGWQVQPNAVTIQQKIQEALAIACQKKVHITASGRTDQGVHALGQAAHIHLDNKIDPNRLYLTLNGLLPSDIRILSVEEAHHSFHARYSALGKKYRYRLTLNRIQKPFDRLYSWHIKHRIEKSLLIECSQLFVGEHDFTAFANESHRGAAGRNAVRTIHSIECIEEEDGIALVFYGNGFLYKMVRNIVGTLVDVASGKLHPQAIQDMFVSKDRRKSGVAAPPLGLCLLEVFYSDKID